jgi:hypothetical protein
MAKLNWDRARKPKTTPQFKPKHTPEQIARSKHKHRPIDWSNHRYE